MRKNNLLRGLLFVSGILLSYFANAQTNPTAQSLPYLQDFSGVAHTSTTYPAGWQGWTMSTSPGSVYNTGGPTADRTLLASSTAATNSGNVHNFNGKLGYLNTNSLDLTLALAINTTGLGTVTVNYDVMTIRNPYDGGANTRINEVTLQYRIGTSGTWTSLTGIEYQNNTTLQTTAVTTPQNLQSKSITLPSACNNQAVVQLRWPSRQVSGGGSRPSFAIDNVSVTGSALAPTITLSRSSINFGNVLVGNNSADSVYTVSGQYLTNDITVSTGGDYTVSLTSGSGYTTTLTLTQSGGSVASTSVYVRFSPTTAGPSGGVVSHTTLGGNNPDLPLSGSGASCSPATISPAGPLILCDGASAVLTASSGASYSWSTGETTQSITVTTAGTYSVTVSDGGACTVTSSPVTVTTNSFSYSGPILSENMGTVGGSILVNSATSWQQNGVFGYSSTSTTQTDLRITSSSSGYSGVSGGANVFFSASSDRNFIISGINTLGHSGLVLTFGMLQSAVTGSVAPLTLELSTDGINWTTVSYGTPTTTAWTQYTVSSGIPATANLRIRFSKTASNTAQHRLDDVILSGTTTTAIITSTTINAICGSGTLHLVANIPSANLWSTSATTQSIDVNAAGSFNSVVTIANGCAQTSNTINVIVATPPSHTATGTNLSCNASMDGSIGFSVTNGTAPFEYSVNNGSTYLPASPVTGLNTGTYVTIVRDANGCTSPAQSVTLTQPSAITFSASGSPVSCVGGTDGTITITGEAGGAGGPYEFSIDNGGSWQTSGSYTGLAANTYQVRVKDASGCISPASPVVVGTSPIVYTINATAGSNGSISPAGVSNVDCGTNLSYTITPGSCYQIDDVLVDGVSVGAVSSYTFSNVTTNHTISASFSIITYTVTSTAGAGGTVTPLGVQTVNCNDNSSFTITPDPGFVILDVVVDGGSVGPVASYTFNNVVANHTIDATFAACNNPATANAGPDAAVCAGSSIALAGVIGGGASDGVWSTSGSGSFNTSTLYSQATTYTPSLADITSGTVILTLTSDDPDGAGGCPSVSDQMVLTINPVPVVSIGGNNFFCTGGSTVLSANVSAGGPATSWSWSIGGSPISGANSATYSASVAGDYTVTVSNSFGCSSTSSILTVSENTPPTAPTISPAGPLSICNGSSVVLTSSYASGNTWSSGATTESITVTANGSYTVTYTDGNGCSATSAPVSVTVIVASASITPGGSTTFCDGDSVLLSANSGTAYLWSNGATMQDIYAKTAGNYSVTVTDANGCTATSAPESVIVNTYSFSGVFYSENMGSPSANTDISAYTNFQNQNIITYSSTTTGQSQVRSTTASTGYTGASGGGNVFMGFSTITGNDRNFIISGINSQYYTGITLSFGMLRTDATTSLVVEVSSDGIIYTPLTFTQPGTNNTWTKITPSGVIPATANLRIRFRKSAANTTQFRIDDISLSGTANRVAVTAPRGTAICDGSFLPVLSNIPIGNNWSNGDIAQATFATYPADFYSYVIGGNGCISRSDTVTMSVIPVPVITTSTTDPTCGVDTNGLAVAEGMFATAPYTYSWNTSPVTLNDTAANLRAGSYTVTVTDANGCSAQSNVTLNPPPSIDVTVLPGIACFGECNGTATPIPQNGLGPYTFAWDTVNKTIGNFYNIEVATKTVAHPFFGQGSTNGYSVNSIEGRVLTLVRGVTYSFNINATGFPFIISSDSVGGNYTNEVTTGVTNSRTQSGVLTFTPDNTHPNLLYYTCGTATYMGYRIHIVNGPTDSVLTGLCTGVYSVGVRDAAGCSGVALVFVPENAQLTASCSASDATCFGGDGSITVSATGGSEPYSGVGTFNVPAGNYTYTVTDFAGCTASCSATVAEPAEIIVASFTPTSGSVGSSVTISGSGFTGATDVSFNGTSASFTVDNDGQITVTVPVGATSGPITVSVGSCSGVSAASFTIVPATVTLNLKLYLQGYYNGGVMNPAWTNQFRTDLGNGNPATPTGNEADLVMVELYDSNNALQYADSVMIMIDGTGSIVYPSTLNGQSYYILVKHRSHLQTRSAGLVNFTSTTLYDFTTSETQADNNGSNASMIEVDSGVWAFYSGDVTQDGFIGGDDVGQVDNDNLAGLYFDYLTSDVNGDGFVGGDDVGIVDNNNLLGIYYLYP